MLDTEDKVALQDAGEQVGRAINAETNEFTGSVRFNFKKGRVINWNFDFTDWPERPK